jgi:hypothetical protein
MRWFTLSRLQWSEAKKMVGADEEFADSDEVLRKGSTKLD